MFCLMCAQEILYQNTQANLYKTTTLGTQKSGHIAEVFSFQFHTHSAIHFFRNSQLFWFQWNC